MEKKKKGVPVYVFLIVFLALLGVTFFSGRLSTRAVRSAQNGAILALNDTITTYQAIIGGLEQTVYEKDQIILTQEMAINSGLIEVDRLKAMHLRRVSQVTHLQAELVAARDSIAIEPTIINDTVFVEPGDGKIYAKLPFSWAYQDEWIWLTTGINYDKKGWFDLRAQVPATITLGDKRMGLFKTTPVVNLTTPNPYLEITDIQMVNVQQRRWYQHWAIPVTGGVIGGIFVWETLRSLLTE